MRSHGSMTLTNTKRAGKKCNTRGYEDEDEVIGGGQIKLIHECDQHSKTVKVRVNRKSITWNKTRRGVSETDKESKG